MAEHANRGRAAYLEEWIDGVTVQESGGDEEDGTKAGFAWNLYDPH